MAFLKGLAGSNEIDEYRLEAGMAGHFGDNEGSGLARIQ
jgi:hypothetical protein